MSKLDDILTEGHTRGASDVLIVAGTPPVFRIDGQLERQVGDKLIPSDTEGFAKEILTEELWDVLQDKREVDLSYGVPGVSRFRVNVFHQRSSISIAFRLISSEIPSIEELGVPSILKDIIMKPYGLFLVTGPTGSGKSTSLAAMIDYMNKSVSRHVITLEDPIEYLHRHDKSIIEQREIGFDTMSFKNGLRASLREDPDVILVGELRDADTIETALTAAETGHLVLGTLHTKDAIGTIDRMIDVFPAEQRDQTRTVLADVLLGVMSQRLFRRIDQSGRSVATEMLINNSAVKNLIRSNKMNQIQNVLQTSKNEGMHTIQSSIKSLVEAGKISSRELELYATSNSFKN